MKQILYIQLLTWIAALTTVSCLDDKDSIATRDFDRVLAIDSITPADGNTRLVYIGDTLRLSPEITFSEGSSAEDYSYAWMIGKDTVSHARDLEWQVKIPKGYERERNVPGVLIVRHATNGLEFRQSFTLEIQSNLTPAYIAVYETADGTLEWVSIQGKPDNFSRFIPGMHRLTNSTEEAIRGRFRGALIATNELALFTDEAPGYGYCISIRDNAEEEESAPLGKLIAPISERVYRGTNSNLDFRSIRYCEGGTRYIVMNDDLYAFNGTNKRLPMFDENTYLSERDIAQVMASKQFMRYKKAILIRRKDNTIACIHEYDDTPETVLTKEGRAFKSDTLYGMFTESTGLASKKPYKIYLIGQSDGRNNLYEFDVTYSSALKRFNVPVWSKTIPLPASTVAEARFWFGAYSVRYGFYATAHEIYRFDYLDIATFKPETTPFKRFPPQYEIIEIYPIIKGSGLKDADDYTVVYLYDSSKDSTTIHVYDTVTGETIREYPDAIPGRGRDFIKC